MNWLMRTISRRQDVPVNMVAALGSLITRREEGAERVGTIIYFLAGMIFAGIYLGLFVTTGLTGVGSILTLGFGFGLIHGVIVTFGLMIMVDGYTPSKNTVMRLFPLVSSTSLATLFSVD